MKGENHHYQYLIHECTNVLYSLAVLRYFFILHLWHQCPMWQAYESLPDEKLLRGQWKKQNHTPYHGLNPVPDLRKVSSYFEKSRIRNCNTEATTSYLFSSLVRWSEENNTKNEFSTKRNSKIYTRWSGLPVLSEHSFEEEPILHMNLQAHKPFFNTLQ